jgi:hypothetical protein
MHFLEEKEIMRDALCSQSCIIATDDSAPTGKASLAMAVALRDAHDMHHLVPGRRVWYVVGVAISTCCRSTLYRAEGYGMLSVLRFLLAAAAPFSCNSASPRHIISAPKMPSIDWLIAVYWVLLPSSTHTIDE